MGSAGKKLSARMEPDRFRLARGEPRLVHDIGEIVEVQKAGGRFEITVYAEDAAGHHPLKGRVHLGPVTVSTNEPFFHRFSSELNEDTGVWSRDPVWVEVPGYETAEVIYEIEVEEPPDSGLSDSPATARP